VAEALEYANPQKALRDHVDEEDKGLNESFTPGGTQKIIFINEKLKKIGILPIIRQ
jgi:anti-repressor protein